jgi:quinoprotein glucose dehydrogenase
MPWILTMVSTKSDVTGLPVRGQQLFNQICAPCHGLDRQGNIAQNVPTLIGIKAKSTPEQILALLDTGRGVMPSFAFLSPAQKRALADLVLELKPATQDPIRDQALAGEDVLGGIPYTHTGYNRWLDTNGYPAVKPPWGTLNAIDLNTGEYRWRVPLGEFPELTARGIPQTGTENYGGPIVTAGNLIFIAATKDEQIRAFDKRNGKMLWQAPLPAGGYATPATYMAGGRQFVVIACGGGKMGTKSGDAYVAFALP